MKCDDGFGMEVQSWLHRVAIGGTLNLKGPRLTLTTFL